MKKNTTIRISDITMEKIILRAEELGITKSELIRNVLDNHFKILFLRSYDNKPSEQEKQQQKFNFN